MKFRSSKTGFEPLRVVGGVAALVISIRKVDVRLHGKENSNSHGARPVHLIISMIKWIRTNRLSIKNSLSVLSEALEGLLDNTDEPHRIVIDRLFLS